MPKRLPTAQRPKFSTPQDKRERDSFYNRSSWIKLRTAYLAEHPLCTKCQEEGRLTPAHHVHHILARLKYPEIAYDTDNLQGLCARHHTLHEMAERQKRS